MVTRVSGPPARIESTASSATSSLPSRDTACVRPEFRDVPGYGHPIGTVAATPAR